MDKYMANITNTTAGITCNKGANQLLREAEMPTSGFEINPLMVV